MKSICVFTGSNQGNNKLYEQAAVILGKEIAKRGIHLVYGGGRKGLMGTLADTVLKNGGRVTGVITHLLYELEGHQGLTTLHALETMQERKLMMAELSDGFITMPGGLGTFEELFEVWVAAKLGLHAKPIGLLNTNNFYAGLLTLLGCTVEKGFLSSKHSALMRVSTDPIELLNSLVDEAISA